MKDQIQSSKMGEKDQNQSSKMGEEDSKDQNQSSKMGKESKDQKEQLQSEFEDYEYGDDWNIENPENDDEYEWNNADWEASFHIMRRAKEKDGINAVTVLSYGEPERSYFSCLACHPLLEDDELLMDHKGLRSHLEGNQHQEMVAFSKSTLFGQNQWPFHDAWFFFDESQLQLQPHDPGLDNLLIPDVIIKGKVCSLSLKQIGFGEMGGAVIHNKKNTGGVHPSEYSKIWLCWLGSKQEKSSNDALPLLDCGIVTFRYDREMCAQDDFSEKFVVKKKSMLTLIVDVDTAYRTCPICELRLVPGRDVSCLLDEKAQRLTCCLKNKPVHLYHTSCLVHWIMYTFWKHHMDEAEISARVEMRKSKGWKKIPQSADQIPTVFCPECDRTTSDKLAFYAHMIKAKREWIKDPRSLEKCSVGLKLVSDAENDEEDGKAWMKTVKFYRADV